MFSNIEVAREYGRRLPTFASQAEAETALFLLRDQRLSQISRWAAGSDEFVADGTPESLKALEVWYFEVVASNRPAIGVTAGEFEAAIGAYLGQMLVGAAGFEWVVDQDAFVPGHYGIGVRKGLLTLMLTHGFTPDPLIRNKRKQSLYRFYKRHAA